MKSLGFERNDLQYCRLIWWWGYIRLKPPEADVIHENVSDEFQRQVNESDFPIVYNWIVLIYM